MRKTPESEEKYLHVVELLQTCARCENIEQTDHLQAKRQIQRSGNVFVVKQPQKNKMLLMKY